MRFSTLAAAIVVLMQATAAFAGPDSGPVEGEVIQRKRPEPQQAAPPPPAAQPAPPPAEEPNPDQYADEDGGEQTTIIQNNTVIQNEQYNEGVAGEFYEPGYGGLPPGFVAVRCVIRGAGVSPQFGPMITILGLDRWNRVYKMLPTPIPAQARFEALNGMRLNGVCPGAPAQPQYVPRVPTPPVFMPYRGQVRPPVVFNNDPRLGVYGPRPGYGRPNNGPYAAPPMRGFMHP